MDYQQLKEEIKQIVEIASSVPDNFKDKCFELLLADLIRTTSKSPEGKPLDDEKRKEHEPESGKQPVVEGVTAIPIKTQLRVFMRKTNVTKDELDKVLLFDGQEVHFVREPHNVPVATGQIEWALLLGLKNAIENDSLSTDPEAVRSVCQEKGFYDKANFAANFKRSNNAIYFKGVLESQGEAQPLTGEGQDVLGKLVKRLAAQPD
jgi:hypothetical protein